MIQGRTKLSCWMGLPVVLMGLFFAGLARADWNNQPDNTPEFVQVGFGPYGDQLPGDGESYCGPTSLSMELYWVGSNGFTQLAPSSYNPNNPLDVAGARNLDLVLAGLCATSSTGGTYGSGLATGIDTYLAAKGIGLSQYSTNPSDPVNNPLNNPDLSFLANNFQLNAGSNPTSITFQYFSVGWYEAVTATHWVNEGGHVLAPVSADLVNSTLTLNNAYPDAFENVPNTAAYGQQTVGVSSVAAGITIDELTTGSGGLPSQNFSQIQTPILGDGTNQKAVIWGAEAWTIDISALPTSGGYAPQTWTINGTKAINTNGGDLSVIAPLTGTGGLNKQGEGELVLQASNDLSGQTTVQGGSLVSTVTSGTPFGTGSIVLKSNATLEVRPDDATPSDINLQIAAGSSSQLIVQDGGGTLALTKGANTSLTVTLGGYTDGATANISRVNYGSLVIAPDAGLAALGNSIQLYVTGTSNNLPPVNNGMLPTYIVGQDNDTNGSGAFLTYSAQGFITAAVTQASDVDINSGSVTANTVYDANVAQNVTSGNAVSVYAMEVDGVTVGGSGPGTTLAIGGQGAGTTAGIILNQGTIATSQLDFGPAEGAIYTSQGDSAISSQMNGSGGFMKFGPGTLTMSADNSSSLSGMVTVNSGTLVAGGSGSATGSGNVQVNPNATFKIDSGATVAGAVNVESNGTLQLAGGTAGAGVTVASYSQSSSTAGGILKGHGTITGMATVGGLIVAGPETAGIIEFQNGANLNNSQFFWQLNALVDNASSSMGLGWNGLQFDLGSQTQLGTSANPMTVYLDFSLVQGPETNNSFWQTSHEWTLMTFNDNQWGAYIDWGNFSFDEGNFSGSYGGPDSTTYTLIYTPTVPEPSTWAMLVGGLVLLAFFQRRLKRG